MAAFALGCASQPQGAGPEPDRVVAVDLPEVVTAAELASGTVAVPPTPAPGVVFAPGVLDAATPKLKAFLDTCLRHYIAKDLPALERCFDPAHLKEQSHSPVKRVVLESLGFFILSNHVSGPQTNDDVAVWRDLSLIDVQGVKRRPGVWDFTGRVVSGQSTWELQLSVYGDDTTGYVLRGPVG